ncbi:MAG TPA: hypothetical protein VJH24_05445 [Candidatus Bilamarchaeaceae archaeon]|nr:hypothetical protein [Candidatus Bilamarchaeaceae archaeon]
MKRIYAFDLNKKAELLKILEADPYAGDSFARIGYKLREGASLGEDKNKLYLYISADDSFIKKADEKLKPLASALKPKDEKHILEKILAEEEAAESGLGNIFGD